MTATTLKLNCGPKRAGTLLVLMAATTVGCATTPAAQTAASTVMDAPPVARRSVQNIRLEPAQIDGQTSWIIEPDVPRIPKIKGLDRQLPPHIEQRLSRAFDLAQRGATYSANLEFREVLLLCALELDAREGTTSHREAMRQGLVALDEADEISGQRIDWSDAAEVHTATCGHSTPVLRGTIPPGADSIQVVQLYYTYAEERLTYACQGVPGASVAYYGLARSYVQPGTRYVHAAGKAAMLQRVALHLAPQNVLAGNELGVLLAQHGHLNEAQSLFEQCVAMDASPEAWQNLAAVHAKKGNAEASRAALTESSRLAASRAAAQTPVGDSAGGNSTTAAPTAALAAETNTNNETFASDGLNDTHRDRRGFWKKFALSQKLPNMFHR